MLLVLLTAPVSTVVVPRGAVSLLAAVLVLLSLLLSVLLSVLMPAAARAAGPKLTSGQAPVFSAAIARRIASCASLSFSAGVS